MKTIFDLLRAKQWTKNLLIYAALVFTKNLFNGPFLIKSTIGFVLWCLIASSIYIVNDVRDCKEDSYHPVKKKRPIASGKISKDTAIAISVMLLLVSLLGSFLIDRPFFLVILIYAILNTLYSIVLKHIVIIDVFIVAANYVIRAVSGAVIINVTISPWFLICTSLLALFLILAKRRYELSLRESSKHRKILNEYSIPLLDEMISVVTSSTVIAYSLYTFTSQTAQSHNLLMLTIPFVLYGIFRYLYLIHKKNMGGSPELVLLKDIPLIIDIVLYVITTLIIMYLKK